MSIRPDLLAAKLESSVFDDSPFPEKSPLRSRWREMLWFLQASAMPAGGLEKLVATLLRDYAPLFTTSSMQAAGAPQDGKYTIAQCLTAWKTFDSRLASSRVCRFDRSPDDEREHHLNYRAGDPEKFPDFLAMHFDADLTAALVDRGEGCDRAAILAAVEKFNWPFLSRTCLSNARSGLAQFLADLCTEAGTGFRFPWYCADLFNILLDHMGAFAADIEATIAKTEVTRTVFRELEFACSEKVPVPLIGESRIGKTSSVSVWVAMRPGRARLVTVPESGRERDFLRAHADAFGIEYTPATTLSKLKWDVEYVHRRCGLFIAYEEAHFLIPVSYHKSSPPSRIEWIRNQVIDRELGCAFLATPQSYAQTLDEFAKRTSYNFSQWLGRLAPPVLLRADLEPADMMAVARLHFPDWPEPYLKLIAARAITSEGYLKSMELTAKRARFLARERGHESPLLDDVKDAIAQMMPGAGAPQIVRDGPAPSAPAPTPRAPAAAPLPPVRRGGADDTFSGDNNRLERLPKGANELTEAEP